MVAGSSQAKLLDAYHHLLPASPSSRPPACLSRPWPRPPERIWDQEGEGGIRKKKDRTVGLRAHCGAPLQQQSQSREQQQQQVVEDEIGYILCSNCKVFKCVTFPDYGDGVM
ncbi:hypothetical protein Taro_018610 [Colocasia esculenta]|uniref:Uncharacterized protein n=1 Tax=Colocasia esculenta TaxID=4460 RepID=A0A843UZM7_COLES|nr:hypothetical protein [Colocasia esculenta]